MNMRFSTEAANADFLGEDTPDAADGMSESVGADGRPRNGADPKARPQARSQPPRDGDAEAKPGKDKDAAKP